LLTIRVASRWTSGTISVEESVMPLRDHFHSPVNDKHHWDAVHCGWPMEIVRTLYDLLPPGFVAEPRVYHGAPFEVDIAMLDASDRDSNFDIGMGSTATLTAATPTFTAITDLDTLDEFEVRIYDTNRERTLVAAIEIVSPSNKDRPETRDQFTGKLAALLREDVCVTVIDIVTIRRANLYAEFLARINERDPALGEAPPMLYAVTLRGRKERKKRPRLDAWFFPLTIGQQLPVVPIWLTADERIELPLEPSYQETCRLLRIA
jgi:hypothetical protein